MNNLLLSEAIGDICGQPYEFHPVKDYDAVDLLSGYEYTDDTVCTFACAEALLRHLNMAVNLRERCRRDPNRGYGTRFAMWVVSNDLQPAYDSFGNGSAMRCSAAGWLAKTEDECIELATQTALPTHNHPEGIKGAVAAALAIFYGKMGKDKQFIRYNVLNKYYPEWQNKSYKEIQPSFEFDESCQLTVPAALICFLESKDYADCLKLCIALGGDADTLGAIAGPMAYAFYKEMPEELVANALDRLPFWMLQLNEKFDQKCNE